jgi:hypothetical protein
MDSRRMTRNPRRRADGIGNVPTSGHRQKPELRRRIILDMLGCGVRLVDISTHSGAALHAALHIGRSRVNIALSEEFPFCTGYCIKINRGPLG